MPDAVRNTCHPEQPEQRPSWRTIRPAVVLTTGIFFVAVCLFLSLSAVPGPAAFKRHITQQLTKAVALPVQSAPGVRNDARVIYVLGGTQRSLQNKFATAADLYRRGLAKKILFLSEPGITQYDPALGRNLTNDEWALQTLSRLGVDRSAIEPVPAGRHRMFGTLAEARMIISRSRYREVILVTSATHSRRTWLTFSTLASRDHGPSLYLYPSPEYSRWQSLLLEYCKLLVYDYIILPLD